MHKLAIAIAESSVRRNWISEDDKLWCAYAFEKKLLFFAFLLLLAPLTVMIGTLKETAIFVCAFYVLRRRIGGWHAPHAWLCQLLSMALVMAIELVIGPMLMEANAVLLGLIDSLVMIAGLIQSPVYPAQTHFDDDVIHANNVKKNQVLVCIIGLQCLLGAWDSGIVVYSLLAVSTGILSVYIEKLVQYSKRRKNTL